MAPLLHRSIRAVIRNGRRLLEDAEYLRYSEPPTSAYFLIRIAQEEFAKAFLLGLVSREIIPWSPYIFRATRDHTCKQLLCMIMDYLSPDDDEFLAVVRKRQPREFPAKVADAINILRHEKIGRWKSSTWFSSEDPAYDREAEAVAKGQLDRQKQDALYVRLDRLGHVVNNPDEITEETIADEIERGSRMAHLVDGLMDEGSHAGLDFDTVEETFRLLFTDDGVEDGSP